MGQQGDRRSAAAAAGVTGSSPATSALRAIKLLHTVVWAGFAGCIVAIPVLTFLGRFRLAALLALIVLGEVVVLALNRWRCPLTPIAARYTNDRRANFDIYLPEWLARHNKEIFGPLYLASVVLLAVKWMDASI